MAAWESRLRLILASRLRKVSLHVVALHQTQAFRHQMLERNMRVLVIEDQTQLAPWLKRSLEDDGYSIDQIESGGNTDSLDDPADYDVVIQISTTSPVLRVDDLVVDTVRHQVSRGGRPIDLTAREYALLEFLVAHRGQVVTRSQIIQQVWNWSFMPTTNIVDVYIRYLRRKIDETSGKKLIRTVHGVGYMVDG